MGIRRDGLTHKKVQFGLQLGFGFVDNGIGGRQRQGRASFGHTEILDIEARWREKACAERGRTKNVSPVDDPYRHSDSVAHFSKRIIEFRDQLVAEGWPEPVALRRALGCYGAEAGGIDATIKYDHRHDHYEPTVTREWQRQYIAEQAAKRIRSASPPGPSTPEYGDQIEARKYHKP
jgi:hypothetical protein